MNLDRVSPALIALLRDIGAAPRPSPALHAQALLRAHLLEKIARALSADGASALLVKGAALALTVYPDPASRPMGDIDLLVPRALCDGVVAALTREGGVVRAPPGRRWSAEMFGETVVRMPVGAMSMLVEVHTTLDKLVRRPLDEDALFVGARAAPGLPGLLIPAPEDHVILVAIHAATHDFDHPPALLDVELLLRRGLDQAALIARARAARAGTVLFILLRMLRELGAASVPEALVTALDPGPIRRALVDRLRAPSASAGELGLPWILRQTLLREDVGAWSLGVLRYAALRGVERIWLREG